MLNKPCSSISVFCQAAELLNHPHLQPYVLKIHLKLNSPRRHTYPTQWSPSNYMKKIRFVDSPECIPMPTDREKRWSFSNDRTLNPSISVNGHDTSSCFSRRASLSHTFSDLSIGHGSEGFGSDRVEVSDIPSISRTPRLTAVKEAFTPRRRLSTSKVSRTPVKNPSRSSRRVSLPISTVPSTVGPPYTTNIGLLRSNESPNVSVNKPRIDKIAEFPLTSPEDSILPDIKRPPSMPPNPDRSITKDKCMVHQPSEAPRNTSQSLQNNNSGSRKSDGDNNRATDRISRTSSCSSSESRQRKFDTSSYQQRAEALEGLLEFSARLLQQKRFEELGVLLKPFGPEKASPRETAIWLSKSFKDTAV